ncbi:MAG TPA: ABC transporter permease [Lacunisphaera sp.]|nr:ABC transporter permease [Lacunisphaera sp.]
MLSDLRLALRSLAKVPGYTAVIVLTLTLGIGANTAIFSFFNGILLRPLPYRDAANVVVLKKSADDFNDPVGAEVGVYAADFREMQPQLRTLEGVSTFTLDIATLTGRDTATLVTSAVVTPNFFSVLGAKPALGRVFSADDAPVGGPRLVTLSHDFWQSHFGGSHDVIGQTITANQVPFTIVGVMSPDFDFPREAQFWATPAADVPEDAIGQAPMNFSGRGGSLRTVIGRLAPGVTVAQAQSELRNVLAQLPNPNQVQRAGFLVTLRDHSVGDVRPALAVLLGCVGLVLLIACLNVANLMLSRATARERDIAIRLALGANRWRIARQLLAESLVLALAGGLLGQLASLWALEVLVKLAPAELPRLAAIEVDGAVLGFALIVSIATGLASGLAPILGTLRSNVSDRIRAGGDRAGSAGPLAGRLRGILVAGEVAISLMLLVAAGLLLRSLAEMQSLSWGFRPAEVVSARVSFLSDRYAENSARVTFYRALHQRLTSQPGVHAAGTSLDRIGVSWINLPYTPQGEVYPNPADRPIANYHIISPDYLRTLGIAVIEGRTFAESDDPNAPAVVIDSAIARRHYPDGAVGKALKIVSPAGEIDVPIIGVASNVASDGPVGPARPDIYFSFLGFPQNNFHMHMRTSLGAAAAERVLRQAVAAIDPDVPVTKFATMEQVVGEPAAARHFPLGLLGAFAFLALLLASVGIYAVTGYAVTQRTREIGVRMALGAPRLSVVRLILRQGFHPILAGLGVGLVGAVVTALAMRKLLFGVAPLDAATFAIVPLALALVAALACWLPARRATKVDPMVALRAE